MVVERGLARCPRCVSVADYAFIEDVSGMRYEVCCRKCGERYEEESRPSAAVVPVPAPEPPIEWPRDRDPVPPRDWRAELRERIPAEHVVRVTAVLRSGGSAAARHGRDGAAAASRRLSDVNDRARAWIRARRQQDEISSGADDAVPADQTGG